MRIGSHEIGPGHPTYTIAEIGSSWVANIDAALDLIDAAAAAGADAAKFQAGHADHVYDPVQFPAEHASFQQWVEPTLGVLPRLAERCAERDIDFGCSAFCLDALGAVDPFVKWHKVASIEATWGDLVSAARLTGKPVLVSNGAGDGAMGWGDGFGLGPVIPLHCVVSYPADPSECHLRSHPSDIWGLSDHTIHPTVAPCAAVALGACVIEKHFRLGQPDSIGMQAYGALDKPPDWGHSLWPAAFREMVDAIRLTEKVLGSSEKHIRESERPMLKYRRGPKGLRGA